MWLLLFEYWLYWTHYNFSSWICLLIHYISIIPHLWISFFLPLICIIYLYQKPCLSLHATQCGINEAIWFALQYMCEKKYHSNHTKDSVSQFWGSICLPDTTNVLCHKMCQQSHWKFPDSVLDHVNLKFVSRTSKLLLIWIQEELEEAIKRIHQKSVNQQRNLLGAQKFPRKQGCLTNCIWFSLYFLNNSCEA